MKTIVMTVMMIGVISMRVFAHDGDHQITILSDKMDILYLKVSSDYVGAALTVVDSTGTKVMESTVSSRKVLIDFIEQHSGDYIVHIEKNGFSQDLKYHKV
jgi:hypothetical protein